MEMERRSGLRKPVDVDVVIDNQPLCLLRGTIDDIAIGGLFVKTGGGLDVQSRVELVLMLRHNGTTQVYRLPALVVRVTDDGAGLKLDEYDLNAFRVLVALLIENSKRAAAASTPQLRVRDEFDAHDFSHATGHGSKPSPSRDSMRNLSPYIGESDNQLKVPS